MSATTRRLALDFDGVVIESVKIKQDAFYALFESYPRYSEIRRYLDANSGISRYVKFRHVQENILGRPYSKEDEAEMDRRFTEIMLEGVLDSPFVKGAEDFLKWCPLPIDVVSAMPLRELKIIVERRALAHRFEELHGFPGRKADQIRSILASRRIGPQELLFVGDSFEDGVAAREAGVRFIGRVNKDNPAAFDGPVVADLEELRALMEKSLSQPR